MAALPNMAKGPKMSQSFAPTQNLVSAVTHAKKGPFKMASKGT